MTFGNILSELSYYDEIAAERPKELRGIDKQLLFVEGTKVPKQDEEKEKYKPDEDAEKRILKKAKKKKPE